MKKKGFKGSDTRKGRRTVGGGVVFLKIFCKHHKWRENTGEMTQHLTAMLLRKGKLLSASGGAGVAGGGEENSAFLVFRAGRKYKLCSP